MSDLTTADRLLGHQLSLALDRVPDWRLSNDRSKIERTLIFADFVQAFAFMTEVASIAEAMNHHPEWSNVWNRVEIALLTHTAGGVTRADLDLASQIDSVAARIAPICSLEPDGSCGGCH
jgi:4a-hydroxytetrahydrobiopterin dehydratase